MKMEMFQNVNSSSVRPSRVMETGDGDGQTS